MILFYIKLFVPHNTAKQKGVHMKKICLTLVCLGLCACECPTPYNPDGTVEAYPGVAATPAYQYNASATYYQPDYESMEIVYYENPLLTDSVPVPYESEIVRRITVSEQWFTTVKENPTVPAESIRVIRQTTPEPKVEVYQNKPLIQLQPQGQSTTQPQMYTQPQPRAIKAPQKLPGIR